MLWLKQHTARIQALVDERTSESLTFAALECRLAIEQVCYERLRNAHDYISHDDLRRWQPGEIVNQLIQDVDPHIASSFTLSVSTKPVKSGDLPRTQENFEDEEYVEIGQQVGFDAKQLGVLWHALGSFLHVRLPTSRDDAVEFFRNPKAIEKKVLDALVELRRLEDGTLISSGIGPNVSFECDCGTLNKRRGALLKQDQIVSCLNRECPETWVVHVDGHDFKFERRTVHVRCLDCGGMNVVPEEKLAKLPRVDPPPLVCGECDADVQLVWKLMHRRSKPSAHGDNALPD